MTRHPKLPLEGEPVETAASNELPPREGGKAPVVISLPAVPEHKDDDAGFDWNRDQADVVVHDQPETAVYKNPFGQIVIRQRGEWNDDDDPCVRFSPENLLRLIHKLTEIEGQGCGQLPGGA